MEIEDFSVEKIRKRLRTLERISVIPKHTKIVPVSFNGINAEWVFPKEHREEAVILFVHGGSYSAGTLGSHRALVARISKESGIKCLSVDYRLAPEHPYPAALDDVTNSYKWLLEQGYSPSKIAISGDSAGAGLLMSSLMMLRDNNVKMPAAVALISPCLDLLGTGSQVKEIQKRDPILDHRMGPFLREQYAPNSDFSHPYLSPLYGDPIGLPPILIHSSDMDILVDDSTRFRDKCNLVNQEIKVELWRGMVHSWQAFAPYIPEAKMSIRKIGLFISEKTS